MSNVESKLASGATLIVTVAPFVDAKALEGEILRAVGGHSALAEKEIAVVVMAIAASPTVEAAFFKCASRAVYRPDGTEESSRKVDRSLFDDPAVGEQARADFYDIFAKVAEANIKPFIQALFSKLGMRLPGAMFDTPASK